MTDIDEVLGGALCLLPAGERHPRSDDLERDSLDWFDRQHLLVDDPKRRKRLRASRIPTGVALAFPRASYRAALWWSRFQLWCTAFDDACAERMAALDLRRYFEAAAETWLATHDAPPPEGATPMSSAFNALAREFDDLVPPVVATRVRQAWRDYLFAAAWEAIVRATGDPPDPVTYLRFRPHFTQLLMNLEFLEHLPGILLTEEERQDSRIRRIRAVACDLFADVNELYSVGIEASGGNAFLPAGSMDHYVAALPARIMTHARNVRDIMGLTFEPKLSSYCASVCRWLVGAIAWHQVAAPHRYSHPGT